MARPPYDEEAARKGRIVEGWINSYLKSKKNMKFRWLNEKGETKKVPDFEILGKEGNVIAGIECEMKDAQFKKYFKYGIHFLGDKIDRLYNSKIPIYYYLVPSDRTVVYYETMANLKKLGRVVHRDTLRMRNEKFYEVSMDLCKVIDLPNENPFFNLKYD